MVTFQYYLHDNYEYSEILEWLRSQGVPENMLEDVAEQVSNKFYEIAFNCFYDSNTGELSVGVK